MIAKYEPLVCKGKITKVTVPINLAFVAVMELNVLVVDGLIDG